MATGDFVQGAYAEGLTGAVATLGSSPTPGNTVVFFESVRQGSSSPTAPTGFTISPAGTTIAFECAITAWSRVVQIGDGTSYNTGSRPAPTLIWVEEREGALAFDAASAGSTSADPNASTHFVGPTITPTAGYVGAIYALFGFKAAGGVPTGTAISPWSEVSDHNFGVHSIYLERIDGTTAGSYTAEFTNAGLVYDSHSYAAQTLALTTAPPSPPPPEPGVHLSIDGVELTDAFDIKIRIELNGTGWGSFKIKRSSPEATAAALTPGNYVLVTIPQIDPDPIFGFFLEGSGAPDTPTIILVSEDEEGGEFATFGGRGGLSYWERAIWLAESFLQKWWPQYKEDEAGTPSSTDIGALALAGDPGWYYHYTVSGSTVTGRTLFHTDAVTAYYDQRKVFTRADGSKITLVHFSDTVYAGYWVHPFGAGVVDYRKKSVYAFGNSILMESIDDGDKPGQVIFAMYGEANAAARPIHPLPAMTVDFDATNDSDGNAWTTTDALKAVSTELGDDYLSTVGKMVNTGVVDVYMDPDLGMHAYNHYGRDLTASVRFAKGLNIADELDREYSDQPTATFAEVQGSEEGAIARVTIAGSPPREISVRGDSADTTVLESLGEAELALRQLHSDTVAFGVDTPIVGHEDPANGLFLPGPPGSANGNYWIGDLVTLHTGTADHDFDEDEVRVAALTITMTDANDLRVVPEVISGFGGIPTLGSPSSSGPSAGSTAGAPSTISDLYQLLSERDQVRGYPSLDDNGLVDFTELPTRWKQPVRFATTGAVTLATGFEPGDVVDGVTLVEGDDFLNKDAATGSQNGIYTVAASGTPLRRGDFDHDVDVLGSVVLVLEGTANAGKAFRLTNTTQPTIGTTALTFAAFPSSSGSAPSAAEDGSVVVSAPTEFDFRHGLDVTDPGGGPARVAVDESELAIPTVIVSLTNKSGASVAAGDVVVLSAANADAFTTTTVAQATFPIGVAQETIANNATGKVAIAGYVSSVNTGGSTFGLRTYLETNGSAKQATANASQRQGTFGVILGTSANPDAILFGVTNQGGSSPSGSITASGYTQTTARLLGRTTASTGAIEEISVGSGLSLSGGSLTATAGGGGAGSDAITGQIGSGGAIIPGLQGSADIRVAAANDDEFDTTDTSDPRTGWTTMGSPTHDINSTQKSAYYVTSTAGSVALQGIYKTCPSIPFTMTAKLNGWTITTDAAERAGIFIGASPLGAIESANMQSSNFLVTAWGSRTSFSANPANLGVGYAPIYLRIIVTSSTNVTYQISVDGKDWASILSARNPGFTVGIVGLFINPVGSKIYALFDWVRFT